MREYCEPIEHSEASMTPAGQRTDVANRWLLAASFYKFLAVRFLSKRENVKRRTREVG